jgi:hypothetical protein
MGTRLDLQTVLESLQEGLQVYFQPPSNVQMSYPAIVYNRDYRYAGFADNKPYATKTRYQVTVIDRDPDSLIPDKVGSMPLSTYVRHFTVDQLNHDIYDLYF